MLTYEFTDDDLDTRTRMAFPDVGQNTQDLYLGWQYNLFGLMCRSNTSSYLGI
jgi:hypothetical protein